MHIKSINRYLKKLLFFPSKKGLNFELLHRDLLSVSKQLQESQIPNVYSKEAMELWNQFSLLVFNIPPQKLRINDIISVDNFGKNNIELFESYLEDFSEKYLHKDDYFPEQFTNLEDLILFLIKADLLNDCIEYFRVQSRWIDA